MSMLLMAKAFGIKVGNAGRKLVLLKLADNANDQGECWPSYQHIADQCEVSRRSAMNHIEALCDAGLVSKVSRKGPKGNASNTYLLTLDGGEKSAPGGGEKSAPPGEMVAPPGEMAAPPPGEMAAPGTSHSFESVSEPITETSPESEKESPHPAGADDNGQPLNKLSRQFEMFMGWQPDNETWQVALMSRNMPPDTTYRQAELADFTAHHADTTRRCGSRAWAQRLAQWVENNRSQESRQTAGGNHADQPSPQKQRAPIGNLTPGEARAEYERQQRERARESGAGQVFDGAFQPGNG